MEDTWKVFFLVALGVLIALAIVAVNQAAVKKGFAEAVKKVQINVYNNVSVTVPENAIKVDVSSSSGAQPETYPYYINTGTGAAAGADPCELSSPAKCQGDCSRFKVVKDSCGVY